MLSRLLTGLITTASTAVMLAAVSAQEPFNIEEATIAEVQAAIADGTTSCVDIVQTYIDRIQHYEARLNSITYLNPKALEVAAELDEQFASGEPMGPLFCAPILIKDNVNTFDMPTSNGTVILRDAVPNADADIAAKIRASGAVILGKAAMGEFANGDYNTIDGVVRNPYDALRTASGSSAGSAVALTTNLTLLAVGSDTSSSIRGPAAFNGIVGLRPTTGLWSRAGIAPKSILFDTAGPMARTVTDVAKLLGVADGLDPADPASVAVYEAHPAVDGLAAGDIDYTTFLKPDAFKGARVGVVRNFFEGGDPEVMALAEAAVEVMRGKGAEIVDITLDPDYFDFYIVNGYNNMRIPADFAFKQDFETYLDTYFGPEVPHKVAEFVDQYETTVAVSEKPVEQMIIDLLAGSLTTSPDDPARAQVLNEFLPANTAYKKALFDDNDVDVLVYPTDYAFAYPVITPILETNDPTFVGGDGPNSFIFAGYSSVANPAIAVPMGVGAAGLPGSITFMGRPYEEGNILGFAYAYEQATNLRVPPDLSKL